MALEHIDLNRLEARAREQLSPARYAYYATGAEDETTLVANSSAWHDLRLRPHVLRDVSNVSTATTVLGQPIDLPVMIAPTAYHRVAHPDGEMATARAAAAAATIMIVSTFATTSLEDVASTGAALWFQLSIHKDRGFTAELVRRAEAAGYGAICVTVDVPVRGRRARLQAEEFVLPDDLSMANLTEMSKRLGVTNREYAAAALDPNVTPEHIEWLAGLGTLPVVVKGVLRGDDASVAVAAGARGIVVSNHGGRQLDGAIATADALQDVVEVVGDTSDVLVDGGIRRGTDIVKALSLGARAVLVGRPIIWSLAVAGQEGIAALLGHFRSETARSLALCGAARPDDTEISMVV